MNMESKIKKKITRPYVRLDSNKTITHSITDNTQSLPKINFRNKNLKLPQINLKDSNKAPSG
jgi:hypothetical protein